MSSSRRRIWSLVVGVGLMLPFVARGAAAQETPAPVWSFTRTLGFRPAEAMHQRSDYAFQVSRDGTWIYRSFGAIEAERAPYDRQGKLPMSLEEFETTLNRSGIDQLPEPDPNAPRIADAPEMVIANNDAEPKWSRSISPRTPLAVEIDRLIGRIVMQVTEIDLGAHPLTEAVDETGTESPLVIVDRAGLDRAFGEQAAAVAETIDFEQHELIVFRWSGSGRDELIPYREPHGKEPLLTIAFRPGMTRDLRSHAVALMVPKGIERRVIRAEVMLRRR